VAERKRSPAPPDPGIIPGGIRDRALQAAYAGRPVYRLLLRPEAGIDAEKELARLLKFALRQCHLRCVSIERVK
jgi:hypothetical protein